jgi:hypothetical protein
MDRRWDLAVTAVLDGLRPAAAPDPTPPDPTPPER